MVGSEIIDKVLNLMTMGELAKVTTLWQQAHYGAVMSGLWQLSHASSEKKQDRRGGKMFLSRGRPCGGADVMS